MRGLNSCKYNLVFLVINFGRKYKQKVAGSSLSLGFLLVASPIPPHRGGAKNRRGKLIPPAILPTPCLLENKFCSFYSIWYIRDYCSEI